MDVAAWLRELGLERHTEAFRVNEVDWDTLPELTEVDLQSLGLPLGSRKKILGLNTECPRSRAKVLH